MSFQDRECIECGLTMFCTRVEIRAHYDSHFLRKRPAGNLIVEYELTVASTGPNNVRRCDGTLENSRRLLLKTSRQPKLVKIGARMCVRFELPSGYRMIVTAQVSEVFERSTKHRPRGFAVEFCELDAFEQAELDAFIHGRYTPPEPVADLTRGEFAPLLSPRKSRAVGTA